MSKHLPFANEARFCDTRQNATLCAAIEDLLHVFPSDQCYAIVDNSEWPLLRNNVVVDSRDFGKLVSVILTICPLEPTNIRWGAMAKASARNPCTNRPMRCTVWLYGMQIHFDAKHPDVAPPSSLCATPSERDVVLAWIAHDGCKKKKTGDDAQQNEEVDVAMGPPSATPLPMLLTPLRLPPPPPPPPPPLPPPLAPPPSPPAPCMSGCCVNSGLFAAGMVCLFGGTRQMCWHVLSATLQASKYYSLLCTDFGQLQNWWAWII